MIDDMGFGQTSPFGGPIPMPTLDRLAQNGLKYNRFHTTALCSPTRRPVDRPQPPLVQHRAGDGDCHCFPGSDGPATEQRAPLAEILRLNGYSTAAFGKCHETPTWERGRPGPSTAGRPVRL